LEAGPEQRNLRKKKSKQEVTPGEETDKKKTRRKGQNERNQFGLRKSLRNDMGEGTLPSKRKLGKGSRRYGGFASVRIRRASNSKGSNRGRIRRFEPQRIRERTTSGQDQDYDVAQPRQHQKAGSEAVSVRRGKYDNRAGVIANLIGVGT